MRKPSSTTDDSGEGRARPGRGVRGLGPLQLARLAAGHGDASTIVTLRDAQLAKHMLLIRAVSDAVRRRASDRRTADLVTESMALLTSAEYEHRGEVWEVLRHPYVGVWAARCLRRATGSSSEHDESLAADTAYLAALAASAAIRADVEFAIEVPLRSGELTLPTLGSVQFGERVAEDAAMIRGGPGGAVAAVRGRRLAIPGRASLSSPPAEEGVAWRPRPMLRAEAAGRTIEVAVEDRDPHRDCHHVAAAAALSDAELARLKRLFAEAWKIIASEHPAHARALAAGLTSLVPLTAPESGGNTSAASRFAFGSVGICPPEDAATLALLLIHEFQHVKLGAVLDLVDLYRPGGQPVHRAPWRDDPRPVGALLHGTYAHLGVTEFWRARRFALTGISAHGADLEFAYWRGHTSEAIAALAASGELTAEGLQFVRSMATTVDTWCAEPLPRNVLVCATQIALYSATAWRLRNLCVEREAVRNLADAWRRGQPCPRLPSASLRARPAATSARPDTLPRLLRLALTQPELLDTSMAESVADLDCAAGRVTAALSGYRTALTVEPAADCAWSGLAVAMRSAMPADLTTSLLARRPEVASAVHREVAEVASVADPVELLRWLAAAGPIEGDEFTSTAARCHS